MTAFKSVAVRWILFWLILGSFSGLFLSSVYVVQDGMIHNGQWGSILSMIRRQTAIGAAAGLLLGAVFQILLALAGLVAPNRPSAKTGDAFQAVADLYSARVKPLAPALAVLLALNLAAAAVLVTLTADGGFKMAAAPLPAGAAAVALHWLLCSRFAAKGLETALLAVFAAGGAALTGLLANEAKFLALTGALTETLLRPDLAGLAGLAPAAAAFLVLLALLTYLYGFARDTGAGTRGFGGAAALPAFFALACGAPWAAAPWVTGAAVPPGNPKNVLLISVDTLRHDFTSFYRETNPPNDVTPNLAEVARRGAVFERAVSQSSWTLPAHASMLTGLNPGDHGAITIKTKLGGNKLTLAEILQSHGYHTGAIVSHMFVNAEYGFSQGFRYFNGDNDLGHYPVTSGDISDLAVRYLENNADGPFFLFLHYFDPHYEFRDHEEYPHSDHYDGWLREEDGIETLIRMRNFLKPADYAHLMDLYREEILYTDREIGRVFRRMEEMGLMENTMVIFVSDHGEEFGEHGWLGHGYSLYNEVIRVPFFITLPDDPNPGRRVPGTVETRSIFSTVLDYLEIPGESAERRGRGLMPLLRPDLHGDAEAFPHEAFTSTWQTDSKQMYALTTDKWKLVVDEYIRETRFFNLVEDPGERNNLHPSGMAVEEEMTRRLVDWAMPDSGPADNGGMELSPAAIEKLKGLGYM